MAQKKKSTSILDRIQPVSALQSNLAMLVFGRSGTGKTQFGSTFPRPLLVIDINEKGTETIAQEEDIDILRVKNWTDLDEIYWELHDGNLASTSGEPYQSIVIDQITNLQDLGMAEIMRRGKKKEGELFSQRNWGQLSGLLKQTITNFKDLDDYNLLLIAHERSFDEGDDEDGAIDPNIGARVMPSVSSTVNGAMDAIGCTFIREEFTKDDDRQVDYCMRIGPHAYYTTKIRRPVGAGPLPDIITNPTYQKIMDLQAGKSLTRKRRRKANAKS